MGLLGKSKTDSKKQEVGFNKQDLTFLLTKLRSAEYKGYEFEQFYHLWNKLTNLLDELDSEK
jgi:hypothetical protein